MISYLACPSCKNYTLEEVEKTVSAQWGDYQLQLINVPVLVCVEEYEHVFDMKVARFMQLLARYFSENATHVKKFNVSNLKEYFYDRKLQNSFIEVIDSQLLNKNDDEEYYINDIELYLLKEKMSKTAKVDTLEELWLAARDAKIDEDDISKMIKHISKSEGEVDE